MNNDTTVSPLTFGQLSLWRSDEAIPVDKRPEWYFTRVWDVPDGIPTGTVRTVLNLLSRRHESLRTTVDAGPARPRQVVRGYVAADLAVEQADGTSDAAWAAVERLAARPFDLGREYGWRALLLRDTEGRPRHLCLAFHHFVADSWALDVLGTEYRTLVGTGDPEWTADRLPPASQPSELAALQQSARWRSRRAGAAEYWRTVLSRYPRATRAGAMSFGTGSGRWRATATSPSFGRALARVAAGTGVTAQAAILAVVLQAVEALRVRLTEPLVLMTSNRFEPRWRDLVSTQNQATVFAVPEQTEDFTEYARRVDWACRTALRHGCYDFDDFTSVVGEVRGAPLNYDYFFNHASTDTVAPDDGADTVPAPATVELGASPQSTGPRLEVRVHGSPVPTVDVRADPELMARDDLGELVRWAHDRVHELATRSPVHVT